MSNVKYISWCPFMASLQQNISGKIKLCGGTVLTHTLTLTAAHCVVYGTTGLHIQFGSVYLFGGQLFQATKIYLHEEYVDSSLFNDIGLVSIFPNEVEFGYSIKPVTIPKLNEDIHYVPKMLMRIYGWGAVSDSKSFSEVLRSTYLPIVDINTCRSLLKDEVPKNTFCLGYFDGHVDSCVGDSGGPVMLEGVQVGITSFGEGCAMPLKPGVYTDLRKYVQWLHLAILTLR